GMPAAKRLFHKSIIQSGTLINVMTKEKSQELGLAVLEKLEISPQEVDKINNVDYAELVKAGQEAVAEINGERKPGSPQFFGFAPSQDGVDLVKQPFSPGFSEMSKDIPLMIGSTLNELMPTVYGEKDLSLEQAKERLKKTYGDNTNKYVELFAEAYPNYTPQD